MPSLSRDMTDTMADRGPDGAGTVGAGAGGARPPSAEDHRPVRAGGPADGRRRPRRDDRLQRLHLQPPRAAPRARGRGPSLLLHRRHRGHRQGLPAVGRQLRRAPDGHVRLLPRRARLGPGGARARPARHQAAVPGRGGRQAAVRVHPARTARGRRRRHLDRPRGAAPVPDVPLGGARAAHDPARGAQAAARRRCWSSSPTAAATRPPTGAPTSAAAPSTRAGRPATGRTPSSRRCARPSTGAWWPTCPSAASCRAGSTRAWSSACSPRRGSATCSPSASASSRTAASRATSSAGPTSSPSGSPPTTTASASPATACSRRWAAPSRP